MRIAANVSFLKPLRALRFSSSILAAGILLISLLFNPANCEAVDGFWLMANNLALTGQANWNYYNGGDAPEGAVMGWMYSGVTALDANIPLNRSLPPGK
jgi:hypothetical protein